MMTPGTALIFISVCLTHAVTACEWGKHGENCEKRCPPNCQVNPQRNLTHCNKETAECSDGCIPGWYAAQCDQLCSKNCLDNVCSHQNGQCTKGCSGNQIGDFCEIAEVLTTTDVKVKTDEATGLSTAHVAVIITISLVAINVIIVVTVVIKRRRQRDNRRKSTGSPKAGTDPGNPKDMPLLPRGHALSSSRNQMIDEYAGVMERDMLEREIQKTEQVFVVTALYSKVKECLKRFRHVTIAGAAGEGKTSMALMLGSEYQKKGYDLYFVNDISEFNLSVVSQGKDQCFIFDDIFGTAGISTDSPHLRRILGYLNSCLEDVTSTVYETYQTRAKHISPLTYREKNISDTFIIFATKSYNLKRIITHLKEKDDYVFFKGASVIDLTQTGYTEDEKRQMFLKHENYNNKRYDCDLVNIFSIKEQMFGFPLTCKLFFSFPESHKQYEQMFLTPITYLRRELQFLLSKMNNRSAALILMLLCDGKLNMRQLEIKSSNQVLEDHLSVVSSFVNNFNRAKVITCVRDFFGTYFTKGDITTFSHPSIYDACAFVLYEINPAFVLKRCSIRFLYERVQAQTVPACETDEDRHVIYVSDAYNDIIASRLAGAIHQGDFRMSVMHPILERQDIVDKVIDELKPFLSHTSVTDKHGNNVFHYACYTGNVYLVCKLLPFCDINSKGADGLTPTGISVLFGLEDLFKLLLSKGADLTLTNDYNDTVLHLACQGGNRSIVEYLLPLFDINSGGQHGRTAVMKAVPSAKKNVVDLLVSKGADLTLIDDFNDIVLHRSSKVGNRSIVEYLLPLFDINSRGQHGRTAVMGAAVCAKKDTFDLLVSKGAVLTLTDDYSDTVLHLACEGGNVSIVEYLLPFFDINSRGRHGWTAVMGAAVCAEKDTFDLLVSKGADLTLTDDYNDTVLHLACRGGNRSIVEHLLPLFDINSRGRHGWTGLMQSAVCAKKDTFDLLVSKGADLTLIDDFNDIVLHRSSKVGNRSIVEYLLPLFDINSRGQHGRTAVMGAAVCAKKDTFDLLVSKGAVLTLTDDYSDTVLHLACEGGNVSIVEYLLPFFDINSRGRHGWTAVMGAAVCAEKDTFDLLVSKGADLTLTDDYNDTVLHLACRGGNRSIVEHLLPLFDINSRGEHGRTAVMKAALSAKKDTFDLLVSKGAVLTLTDDYSDTVLHLACQGGNRSIVEHLLPMFDINSRGQHGRTAVMKAALSAKKDTFDLLVSKGAVLTLTDDYSDTVLHLACQGGNRSIVEYLLPLFDINSRGQHGWTAVMRAALIAKKDVFHLLVSKGADLTLTDDDNDTVLHLACLGGNRSIEEYLLPLFDINSRGQHGWTAVMKAALSAKKDTFDLLVSKGAVLTLTDDYSDTVLHLACQGGNRSIVEYLLPLFDINSRGQHGWTAVMRAALIAKKDVFHLLVSKGADLTLTDDTNDTVLHLACQGGNRSIVEYLLPFFDINSRGKHGWTAVMGAALIAKKDVFHLLVSKGADLTLTDDTNDTVLHRACQGGNRSIVEYLLPMFDINSRGQHGRTAVMGAAVCAKKDAFDLLVSKRADVTLTDGDNDNVLHLACQGGNILIVEHLLPMCDINCRGYKGLTPVLNGAYSGKKDTFELLLSKGANPSLTGDNNATLLHAACEGGNIDIVRHVIGDFDINTRGGNGHTPLMLAVGGGHTDVVDFLVDHGADVNMVNSDGDSLLHLACEKGNLKMVKHVMSYSDINLRDNFCWTPLAMAAVEGNYAVFKYLKGLGADLTLTDRAGDDVYTLALQGGCWGIIKELGKAEHSGKSITPWNQLMKSLVKSQMLYLETYSQQSPDLVQTDRFGDSLLHLACRGGNKQCVEYLLPSYDINVRGRYNWTPVMMAAVCGHDDVFQLLVSHKADLSLVSNTGEGITTLARRGNKDDILKYLLEKS